MNFKMTLAPVGKSNKFGAHLGVAMLKHRFNMTIGTRRGPLVKNFVTATPQQILGGVLIQGKQGMVYPQHFEVTVINYQGVPEAFKYPGKEFGH
jgi:hypothetical protein